MSFLSRLFGADPAKLVHKGEQALQSGQPAEALDRFQRALEGSPDDADLAARAEKGVEAASAKLVAMNLEEADLSQEAGELEASAHHLETALDLCRDAEQRKRVEARLDMLDEALDREDEPQRLFTSEGAVDEDMLPEDQWEHLVATLIEPVAEDYEERTPAFRDAVLALNEGESSRARAVFEAMLAEDDDDPLVRFELGRTLMLEEKYAEAATQFALARADIGFDPLDRVGLLHPALLEGEALLNDGRAADAAALLDEAIEDLGESTALLFLRARAEGAQGDHDALDASLSQVLVLSPKLIEAVMMLAHSRAQRGNSAGAIDVLEDGIKRHCASGTCASQPTPIGAARLLARCYLDEEHKPARVEDLLRQVKGGNEGNLEWGDHVLWGRLHKQRGDRSALADSRRAALRSLPPELGKMKPEIERILMEPM
jgi:tetratricopeptide (TPR) repeat protein